MHSRVRLHRRVSVLCALECNQPWHSQGGAVPLQPRITKLRYLWKQEKAKSKRQSSFRILHAE